MSKAPWEHSGPGMLSVLQEVGKTSERRWQLIRIMKDEGFSKQKERERQGCARNPSLAFSSYKDCHGDGRLVA